MLYYFSKKLIRSYWERIERFIVRLHISTYPSLKSHLNGSFGHMKYLVLRFSECPWDELANAVSQSLELLTRGGFDERILGQLQGITRKFRKLKSLHLIYVKWNRSNWVGIVTLLPRKFGSAFETLSIKPKYPYETIRWQSRDGVDMGNLVAVHCPNLNDIRRIYHTMSANKYASLLYLYGSQVRQTTVSTNFNRSTLVELLESCPNAGFSFKGTHFSWTLDLFEILGPCLRGKLDFAFCGWHDTDSENLKLCIGKLDSISEIQVRMDAEQTAQSLFLDVFADLTATHLQKLTLASGVLNATCLRKVQSVMPMIRELYITCNQLGDADALVQVAIWNVFS